jgi:hypothetical protein
MAGLRGASFWDSGAPVVAPVKPRSLEQRVVYLKHFFVNFFGSHTSNRINETDSADKRGILVSEYREQKNISEKKGKTNEKVSLVNSVTNHP